MKLFQPIGPIATYRKLMRRLGFWILSLYLLMILLAGIFQFRATEQALLTENQSLAAQTEQSVDMIYTQMRAISNQILQDPAAISYLYERSNYFYGQPAVQSLLADYVKTNSQIVRYIGLYNGYLGTYETSQGTWPAGQMGLPVGNSPFSLRPREIKLEGSALEALNQEFARLVVFYTRVDDNPQRTNHGLVVTHLDESVFTRLLTAYRDGVAVYLTDGSGIVFASSDPSAFITDLSYLDQFDPVFQSAGGTRLPAESGTFTSGSPWNRDLTTFRRSTASGLFVITVIQTRVIWAAFFRSFLVILLIGLAIAVLTLLIARRLMLSFYAPIEKLIQDVAGTGSKMLDEYAALHQALLLGDQAGRIAQEKYLFDLLTGKPNQEDAERIQHILVEFQANAYLILIGRFDGFAGLAEMNAQDLDSFRFVIINIVSELLAPVGRTTGIVTGDNEVSLIVQLDEAKEPEGLEAILAEAQTQIRRFFPCTVTLAWQSPVLNYEDFNACFSQTRSLFNYRLFLGPNSLISPAKTATANQNIRYPVLQEKRILEALNLRRQDQVLAGIDDFMQALSVGYTPRITNYFSQLLFSVFKQVDNTADLVDEDYDNYIETNSRLIQADQLEEARQIIARFCLELMTLSQEKTRSATEQKHERLHGELIRFLEENLGDPNLSLDSTASRFNLSTGYLGKLVKASSGEAFSSLLSSMRLEKAAELLVSTNQPAYKIAEQVGIPNVTYFSTLFKRQYGLSPAPFREKRGNLGEAGLAVSSAAGNQVNSFTPAD